MALNTTEYKQNGVALDASGNLLVVVYDATAVATYHTSDGLLVDAEQRVVVTYA
jgi:hypothetical protein